MSGEKKATKLAGAKWLREHGLTREDATQLEAALHHLHRHDLAIGNALGSLGYENGEDGEPDELEHVREAIRLLIHGDGL
jgi:hypothetical protein